ncbi:hypothetical protein DFH09DRAFT_27355 [Mycena vulgaris]|nr:hypothetical protein DFH09DRAFT_27355 [Mycena vulgaris]
MQSILESILSETPSNTERFKLLDEIMARAGTDRVENSWLARQRYRVMKTLKKPIRGEEDLLVRLAVEGGGVPFLQSTILPQVISMADTDFLMAFSARLVIEQSLLQTEEFILATRNIVRNLLKLAIERTNFAPSPPTSAPAYSFIEACVKCSHADLVELVVDKLVDLSDLSPATAWMQTSGVLIPLIPRLIASDRPIPGLVKLCRVTIEQYMKQPGSIPPTEAELSTVLDAVVGAQDSAMLSKIADRLSTLAPSEALCRSLIKNLRSREGLLNLDNEGGISISGICMQSLQNLVQRTQYGSDLSLIVRHLQLCLSTDNASVLLHLFPRLLSPAVTSKPYISGVLLPLVHNIQAELASWKISSTSEPFSAVLKQIFELYASKVLGPPKSSDHSSLLMGVKKISCTCVNCAALVKFLLQSQDRQLRLARIGMNQRKHVEENLGKFVGYRAANWGTIKTSPQGLEVNKSDLLYSSIVWKAHQAKLKEALGVVSTSDETILRDIFGGDASYKQFANSMGQDTASEAGPSGPPAKKRRMSASTEVIDLCSP